MLRRKLRGRLRMTREEKAREELEWRRIHDEIELEENDPKIDRDRREFRSKLINVLASMTSSPSLERRLVADVLDCLKNDALFCGSPVSLRKDELLNSIQALLRRCLKLKTVLFYITMHSKYWLSCARV